MYGKYYMYMYMYIHTVHSIQYSTDIHCICTSILCCHRKCDSTYDVYLVPGGVEEVLESYDVAMIESSHDLQLPILTGERGREGEREREQGRQRKGGVARRDMEERGGGSDREGGGGGGGDIEREEREEEGERDIK